MIWKPPYIYSLRLQFKFRGNPLIFKSLQLSLSLSIQILDSKDLYKSSSTIPQPLFHSKKIQDGSSIKQITPRLFSLYLTLKQAKIQRKFWLRWRFTQENLQVWNWCTLVLILASHNECISVLGWWRIIMWVKDHSYMNWKPTNFRPKNHLV